MEISRSAGIVNTSRIKDDIILISKETRAYFTFINTCGPGQCLVILGLIVNVLNIVVFIRQDLRDSVNISLLGLSISDFGSLLFHFFANISCTPAIVAMDLPFYPLQLVYFLVWAHIVFTRVTTGTTAWITFERCLCIMVPLKIKAIITPRRTVTVIVLLYWVMFSSVTPLMYTTQVVWIYDSHRNKSIMGMTTITSRKTIHTITFWINNILPTTFFIFISTCTVILVKALNKNAKWKKRAVFSEQGKLVSQRDNKVAKMVTIISIVFIACYAPGTIVFVLLLVYPQAAFASKQTNLLVVIYSILMDLEAINAASNFFIYLAMSSKFKLVFQNLFCDYYSKEKQGAKYSVPGTTVINVN